MKQHFNCDGRKPIDSAEAMISEIKRFGIIPFFRCTVPGWSIEELTTPECWFFENGADGVLGPWDWKIDAVRTGEIAYGKFLGGKAAFATREWYLDLMNWRRSQPLYQLALSPKRTQYKCKTNADKLMKIISPVALQFIRDTGAIESKELRLLCSQAITPAQIRSMGSNYKHLLTPAIKKNIIDSVLQYLQMGTWSLVGDFERVYRGPDLTYSGWQRSSNTTPEGYFGICESLAFKPEEADVEQSTGSPSWASRFEADIHDDGPECHPLTPEQSRRRIVDHVLEMFPEADLAVVEKLI